MILQALKEYYDRKAADRESGIAPFGWEWKGIPFLFVIDAEGHFIRLEDTREQKGKKAVAHLFLVPTLGEAKGNGIKANLFWENAEYFLGVQTKDSARLERIKEQHLAFKDKIRALQSYSGSTSVMQSIIRYFDNYEIGERIRNVELWKEVEKESGSTFLFAIDGKGVVTDDLDTRTIVDRWRNESKKDDCCRGVCLVSGEEDVLAKLEPNIGGFASTGAHLVSVNNKVTTTANTGKAPAFSSFFKEQGLNSPIGMKASFAYTTALNTLLSKDSRQRMMIGDATAVFWADKANAMEDEFANFFAEPPKDDPDRLTVNVKALFDSLKTGAFAPDAGTTRFFVLGLAPNSARISVRFWWVGTVAELAARLRSYFEDLAIVHGSKDKDHLSLFRLLVSTAQQGKAENINPRLSGELTRAVLEGAAFPETMLRAVLIRIKAEQGDVSYPRAKIIKAFINRKIRKTKSTEKEITIMLDKENPNIGYRLGRLFATLEKIQEAANPGINATIRDKYYASASSTPAAVFGTLMRLAGNHLSKLAKEKPGWKVTLEKLIGEITYKDEKSIGVAKFPAHLKLDDQGQFAIGYYHQRQDFFTKKTDSESITDK